MIFKFLKTILNFLGIFYCTLNEVFVSFGVNCLVDVCTQSSGADFTKGLKLSPFIG